MSVSKKMSSGADNSEQIPNNQWDKAIIDTEAELRFIETHRRRLRQAIAIFRLNKKDGVEWPYPKIKRG